MTFNSLYTLPGQHLLLLCTLVVIHRASSGFLQSLVTRLFERFFQVLSIPSLVRLHLQSQAFCRTSVRHIAQPTLKILDAAILKPFFCWRCPFGWHAILHVLEWLPWTHSKKLWKPPFLHNSKVTRWLQTAVISKRLNRFEQAWWQMKDILMLFIKLT